MTGLQVLCQEVLNLVGEFLQSTFRNDDGIAAIIFLFGDLQVPAFRVLLEVEEVEFAFHLQRVSVEFSSMVWIPLLQVL